MTTPISENFESAGTDGSQRPARARPAGFWQPASSAGVPASSFNSWTAAKKPKRWPSRRPPCDCSCTC